MLDSGRLRSIKTMAGKFAIIIGNSRYDDASLGRLKAPDIDVHELEAVLKAPEVGQFDDVVTLLNQDCASVRKAIARFYDQRQRDDLLLLYFSGHGVKDEQGHLYLALRDTESGLLAGSAIETAFITGRMDRSFSKRQVLVLDCCHSGAFAHGAKAAQGVSVGTAEAFEGTGLGRVVLTATDSTQYAWEGDQVIGDAQNSLFTHFLIKGLKTGAADKDDDGVVTVDELYDYVREQVLTTTPRQTPQKWSYLQRGAIVLAQNPFANRSVLPAEIEEAVNSKLSGLRLEAVGHLEALVHGHHAGRAHAALEALKALALDDSRKVANAALQVLKTQDDSREPAETISVLRPVIADDRDPARRSDIFISYAHEDHDKARALANMFTARGWSVWWDRKIAPGEAYDVVIERELGTCRCAIVLWSNSSVHATWVRNEARRAARRKVLLPILIDAVEMPLEFENLQAADLTSWKTTGEPPELETIVERVLALSPIPTESRARDAVEQSREDAKAGRRKAALARLEQFRPPHYLVNRALTELRAEGERLERERVEAEQRRAEAAARLEREHVETERRQAEAARFEQERVAIDQRHAEAARLERERGETARRQAEAARLEQERVETARQAEAARKRARAETARRDADAARLEHERTAAERLAWEARVEQLRPDSAEDRGVQPIVDADRPTTSLITIGRVLMATTALVAVIAAAWLAGVVPRRVVDIVLRRSPQPQASVANISPPPGSSEAPQPKTPAVRPAGVSTTGVSPSPTPVSGAAPPVVVAPPETVPEKPTERPDLQKVPPKRGDDLGSKRLDDLRTLALSRAQTGARNEALNTATEGLRIDPRDPVLKNLVATMLRDAQASARQAHEDAVEADADTNAEEPFQQGVRREREAMRLQRTGKQEAATRVFWGAADQFNAAATESKETIRREKAAAGQDRRRVKAPDATPAPAAPRLSLIERRDAEQPLVEQALRRYEAAYASLAVNNVRSAYPTAPLDQLAKDFANSQSYTLTVHIDGYQFILTDTLSAVMVAVHISHDVVQKSGARNTRVDKPQTIELEKQGANWIIRQIRSGVSP